MNRNVVSVALVAIFTLVCTGQAFSGWKNLGTASSPATAAPAAPGPVAPISGSMNGPFVETDGACTPGFSNFCLGGNCSCITVTGTASLSKLKKGPAVVSATLDFDAGFISGSDGDCFPAWLEFDVTTPSDAETWSGVGSACDGADGNALPLTGGFGLQTSDVYFGAIMNFVMTPNFKKGTFKVTYKGKAER